ncbi:MAG: phosphatidate cytidylyltransferase [Bacteroidales bacterium]|nr:phosphatidate cytidylyltransferase [Bacteroidales bacterium]
MKPFFTRTLTGFVYAVLVLGSILLGRFAFGTLVLIFLIISLFEFRKLIDADGSKPFLWAYYVINVALYLVLLCYGFSWITFQNVLLSAGVLVFISALYFFITKLYSRRTITCILSGVLYITIPLSLSQFLFDINDNQTSFQVLLGLFIIIWLYDSFAYISGSIVGRHKLAPKVSPKKTWEGAMGGLVFAVAGTYVLSIFLTDLKTLEWLGLAVIIVIFGTFGDLFESQLKRKAGIKESGHVMPGHGGILDRLDSLLFAIPAVFVYIQLF